MWFYQRRGHMTSPSKTYLYKQKPWLSYFPRVGHQDIRTNTSLCGTQWAGVV